AGHAVRGRNARGRIRRSTRDRHRRRPRSRGRRAPARRAHRSRTRVRTPSVTTLTLRDVTLEYSSGGYVVRPIHGLDLDVRDGELLLLLGASGCGKTTL